MKMNIYQKQINFCNFKHIKLMVKKRVLRFKIHKYKINKNIVNLMKIKVETKLTMTPTQTQTPFKNSLYEISMSFKKNNRKIMKKNNLKQMIF